MAAWLVLLFTLLSPPAPLDTAAALRRLGPEQVAERRPVRLSGVVTFADPAGRTFFVQDATAGVLVRAGGFAVPQAGRGVRLDGTSGAGGFAPALDLAAAPQPEPGAPAPAAVSYDLTLANSRWLDSQLVVVWARVESAESGPGFTALAARTPYGTAAIEVYPPLPDAARLVGRVVRARGVLVAGFEGRVVRHAPTVRCAAPPEVRPEAPAGTPVRRIDELMSYTPEPISGRGVRVEGVVTGVVADHNKPGTVVFLQDGTAGIMAAVPQAVRVAVGDRVAASGQLEIVRSRMSLDAATVEVLGPGPAPEPRPASAADLALGNSDSQLVRLEAEAVEVRRLGYRLAAISARCGATRFDVLYDESVAPEWAELPPGARLSLAGVASDFHPSGDAPGGFAVWLRGPDDLVVLSLPAQPFWSDGRLKVAAGGAVGLLVAAAAWALSLKRRVARQTARVREALEGEAAVNARYRDLVENAADAIWETDSAGVLLELNPAAEVLLGVSRERGLGRPVAEFLAPGAEDAARLSRVSKGGCPYELAVASEGGGGAGGTPIEVSVRAGPDGRVLTIARDISERRRLQERVERGQRLEAIGRLAGGIAHDFNNLLTAINGNAELLAVELPAGSESARLARGIAAAGDRAAALTRQLLVFGRQRFVAPRPLDLGALVLATGELLARLMRDRTALVVEADPATPWVLGEPALLEQVVLNLALNGRDAIADSGTVTITTGRGAEGRALLRVADTGSGMSAETLAHIYEPFFTTKPIGQGTGLGLATVYGAVQTLGGSIRCESEVGRGTAFEIELPATRRRPAPPTVADEGPAAPDSPVAPAILLVEDDEGVRGLARLVLEAGGYTVLAAESGPAALALVTARGGPIAMILTDVLMPEQDGRALARQLRALLPGTPVLFMSGYPGDEEGAPGSEFAAEDFLAKPFAPAELLRRVRAVMQRSRPG